jgi:hypothetical protein
MSVELRLKANAALREANMHRFRSVMPFGHCHFNTHHSHYQANLGPHGVFVVAEPHLVEMAEAQFERWVDQMRQVRALARQGSVTTEERSAA